MSAKPKLSAAAAIAGIGQTELSKAAGRSETQLASEAIVAALDDAGLTTDDVDGLVSYTIDPVEETELVRALGIPEVHFSSRVPYGGGGSQGVLLHAATAVAGGAARSWWPTARYGLGSGARFGRAAVGARPTSATSGSTRDAVVFSVRGTDPGIVDVAERHPLYARLRCHQ